MKQGIIQYRLDPDGTIVHEDDFDEQGNHLPYYDDYQSVDVPEAVIDYIIEGAS
jgi:hypothetical protein